MGPARIAAAAAVVLAIGMPASAKPPTLDRLFPAGGRRGQTVAVTASGSFDHWPSRSWTDGPDIRVEMGDEKGKLAITIDAGARPGVRWLRLFDEEGATAPRPFVVGTLPETIEVGSKGGPQTLDGSPVTVNGRLAKTGEVDEFAMPLEKGRTLVASVEANRGLGSPMDAVLQVVSPSGFVLAQDDDDHGLDPLIAFEVPADGTYVVRLFAFPATPDSSIRFAGGDAFIYRLSLTTGGFLDHAEPLAVPRDGPARVEARGWNVPDEARHLEVVADDPDEAIAFHPRLAGAIAVRRESHRTLVAPEPSDAEHPTAIDLPVTITSRIDRPRDRDVFRFAGRKGQRVSFRVESRSLGAPLDPVLVVSDPSGKRLAEADDAGKERDPKLAFTPPEDGDYLLTVRDLHGRGGDRFVYRLTATIPGPDYQLSLAADRFTLTPGKPLTIPVTVERTGGFDGVVEVRAEDLPDGVTAEPVRTAAGKPAAKATVELKLTSEGGPSSAPIRVVGRVVEGTGPERAARVPIAGLDASISHAWLTVLVPRPEEPKKDEKAGTPASSEKP
jgi:hypothetical protein